MKRVHYNLNGQNVNENRVITKRDARKFEKLYKNWTRNLHKPEGIMKEKEAKLDRHIGKMIAKVQKQNVQKGAKPLSIEEINKISSALKAHERETQVIMRHAVGFEVGMRRFLVGAGIFCTMVTYIITTPGEIIPANPQNVMDWIGAVTGGILRYGTSLAFLILYFVHNSEIKSMKNAMADNIQVGLQECISVIERLKGQP